MPRPDLVYRDSDVFLSYINATPGRYETVKELLAKSKAGEIVIVTSTVSIVEVAFSAMEKAGCVLDQVAEQAIDSMWNDRDAIKLIEVTEPINVAARNLMRQPPLIQS